MSAFIRYLPAELLPWLASLVTWLVARALNLPVPLVQTAGIFVLLRVQAFENSVGRSLCPIRLWRRLRASVWTQFARRGITARLTPRCGPGQRHPRYRKVGWRRFSQEQACD